jgi:hypothetical protein
MLAKWIAAVAIQKIAAARIGAVIAPTLNAVS